MLFYLCILIICDSLSLSLSPEMSQAARKAKQTGAPSSQAASVLNPRLLCSRQLEGREIQMHLSNMRGAISTISKDFFHTAASWSNLYSPPDTELDQHLVLSFTLLHRSVWSGTLCYLLFYSILLHHHTAKMAGVSLFIITSLFFFSCSVKKWNSKLTVSTNEVSNVIYSWIISFIYCTLLGLNDPCNFYTLYELSSLSVSFFLRKKQLRWCTGYISTLRQTSLSRSTDLISHLTVGGLAQGPNFKGSFD